MWVCAVFLFLLLYFILNQPLSLSLLWWWIHQHTYICHLYAYKIHTLKQKWNVSDLCVCVFFYVFSRVFCVFVLFNAFFLFARRFHPRINTPSNFVIYFHVCVNLTHETNERKKDVRLTIFEKKNKTKQQTIILISWYFLKVEKKPPTAFQSYLKIRSLVSQSYCLIANNNNYYGLLNLGFLLLLLL